MSQIDNDLLTCALCIDTFTDPRALPCLHTFCGGCLEAMVRRNISRNIKCPLCQESHFVPQNGIQGFRQDFRIKSICESIKRIKISCANKSDPIEKCSYHMDMELLFYCQNYGCQEGICGRCWAEHHNKHTVVSLSDEMKAAKTKMKTLSEANEKQISDHMRSLETAQKELSSKQKAIKETVDQYITKCHAELVNKGNQVCNGANGIIESEMKKIHEAQTSLTHMLAACHIEPNTSSITVHSTLKKLNEVQNAIDSFKIQIRSPTLTTKPLVLNNIFEVKVKEESLSGAEVTNGLVTSCQTDVFLKPVTPCLGTPNSSISTRSRSSSMSSRSLAKSRKPGGNSLSRSCSPSPARLPIKMSLQSPRNQCFGSPFSSLSIPDTIHVKAVLRERWPQQYHSLGGLAIRRNGLVYISVNDGIDVYTIFGKKLFGDRHSCNGDDSADIAFIRSRNRDYLGELDNKYDELRIYCDSCTPDNFNDLISNMRTRMGTSFSLSATKNNLLYTYERHGVVQVACLNTNQFPLIFRCNMNTDISRHRSMTAMETSSGLLVAVASSFHPNASRSFDIAIQAVTDHNFIAWEITWDQIDEHAAYFDLISMQNDGMYFYVLNKRSGSIHVISDTGEHFMKLLGGLRNPTHMSINEDGKHLAVVEDFKHILVYSLHY